MEKKKYEKPTMDVVKIKKNHPILLDSGGGMPGGQDGQQIRMRKRF